MEANLKTRRNSLNLPALIRSGSSIPNISQRRYSLGGVSSDARRFSLRSRGKLNADVKQLLNPTENSYQLAPTDDRKFNVTRVEELLKQILEMKLKGQTYDPQTASVITTSLTEYIRDKVKLLGYKRHKLVVYILLSPDIGQSLEIVSRCLWDDNYDRFASACYHGNGICAVAMTFGLYYE
ncbi:tctex1 domain-containing protein 2-like [Anneissia japonica]|uniref:tctex1 domain-containing protein 2-like n=1 Tax=Anneissia japonica TaxID=1529436 RepID=UPI00142570B4|nr:tctex1 domain-containing protein 2-like [Anneissia japonica]